MSGPIKVTAPRRVEGGILVYLSSEDVYVSAAIVCDRELDGLMSVTPDPVTLVCPDGSTVTGRHAGVFIAMLQGARPAEAAGRLPRQLAGLVDYAERVVLALAVVGLGSLAREAEDADRRTAEREAARAAIASWEVRS
ncbi:MAG TPA: hypothetical protein PLR99_05270 [Polyangiaceae bacterium]|nr:hypothetical protein [Polyangiaceae bacterium]